jgi:type VI secretion system protein ImpK
MREEIANLVYPVLREALHLKERLDRNERLDLAAEQARLTNLLKRENEARQWPAFGGDGAEFKGARFALACWLDELFCFYPGDWGRQWDNSKRETALYGTNDRAILFWEQATLAEARAELDALEAYYLCVMLGFRGDKASRPSELLDWREGIERQIGQGKAVSWPGPDELPKPLPNVPPLRSRERFRRLMVAVVVFIAVALLVLSYNVVSNLSP